MLIGLNGLAGAGKDTVADILVKNHGYKRYAFADAVRDTALAIDPEVLTEHGYNRLTGVIANRGWDKAKREVPEVRRLLQVIGTEAGRQLLGVNVWVDIIHNKLKADGWPDAVITDFRFPNEDEFITGMNGVTWEIRRPNNPDAIPATHASEQYRPDCKYIITNDGNLNELESKVAGMLTFMKLEDSWQQ